MSRHLVRAARWPASISVRPSICPDARPRLRPVARVIQLAFASSVAALAAGQQTAWAQAAASTQQVTDGVHGYDIPAGPLSTALARFATVSGALVAADTKMVQGVNSLGVHGSYRTDEALRRLLAGTGMQGVRDASGGYTLKRLPPAASQPTGEAATLPAITVTGTAIDSEVARLNPPTTVGSKTPLTQREIPQTISIVTQEQIQSQNMRTVDDALHAAPGVTTEINQPGFTSYYSRGFPISTTQFDGVPTGIVTSGISGPADELAMYDRVEVLYGPAGLLNGFGGDGGVINLVRKRAPDFFTGSVQASTGNYANNDLQADIGGPLNDAKTLRGRLVADEQYQHLMQDGTWQRNQQFYGTLEADLTPTTQARVGFSYTDIYGKPMYGLPVYSNYTIPNVSRSTYLGPDWNHFSNQRTSAFAEVEQKLAGGWSAKLSYNYIHTLTDVKTGAIIRAYPDTDLSDRYSVDTDDGNVQNALDLYADGPFQLFGRTHHLTIGANYLHIRDLTNQYLINPNTGLDYEGDITAPLYDNSAYSDAFAGGPENDITNVSTQYGIYGNMRISLADPLTLVASGRVTWWKNDSIPDSDPNNNYFGNVTSHDKLPAKFSPMLGLIYDINKQNTVYGSYSSIYYPQAGYESVSGQVIKPVEGNQYEIGLKSEFLDGKLNTNVALFRIREKNRAMSDPLNSGFYVAEGSAQSQGIELRASGKITPDLTIGGGYTYTDWRNYDDSFTPHQSFSLVTPKHLFKLWADYRLPGELNRWTVGGMAYISSKVSYTDDSGFLSNYTSSGGSYSAGGFATIDAHVSYQINKNLSTTLSMTNLFNRKYITSLGNGGVGTYYGNPRMILLTVKANF